MFCSKTLFPSVTRDFIIPAGCGEQWERLHLHTHGAILIRLRQRRLLKLPCKCLSLITFISVLMWGALVTEHGGSSFRCRCWFLLNTALLHQLTVTLTGYY